MTSQRTYLDHNATAPLRPAAKAAVLAALDVVGNASSVHGEGRRARALVEAAREQVAALVGASPQEVVFTSGATEANTWALRRGFAADGWRVIARAEVEHESVLAGAAASGAEIVSLSCNAEGCIEPENIAELLPTGVGDDPQRVLLTMQAANSETGVLQSIADAAQLVRERGMVMHCDAVQAAGRIGLDFKQLGIDLMSVSAHKLGGPKGVGALVIRDGCDLPALMLGGGQERRRRAGTENVAAIAGFGAAAAAALAGIADIERIRGLRDRLEVGVRELTPDAVVIGEGAARLANTTCIAVPGTQAVALVIKLDLAGIAIGAGSACSSGKIGASTVLAAMGIAPGLADAAIRLSLGWSSCAADVDRFLAAWQTIHAQRAQVRPRPAASTAHAGMPDLMKVGD